MKNYTKQISALVLTAALGFAASSASAFTYTDNTSLDFSSFPTAIAFSPNYSSNGAFSDLYTFTISTASTGGASMDIGNVSGLSITGFSLLNSSNAQIATSPDNITLSFGNLGAGTYGVNVVGTVSDYSNASYDFNAHVSAVPEASEWALMASGLGLFGFIASRRSKATLTA